MSWKGQLNVQHRTCGAQMNIGYGTGAQKIPPVPSAAGAHNYYTTIKTTIDVPCAFLELIVFIKLSVTEK